MNSEEDSVHLIGYRSSSPRPNKRRKGKHSIGRDAGGAEEGIKLHLSDSELTMNGNFGHIKREAVYEESTVFSDSLYGDSLPSMRAQLAATQMISRSKRNEELESSMNAEDRPLLGSEREEGGGGEEKGKLATIFGESMVKSADQLKVKDTGGSGKYKSMGGGMMARRLSRREKLLIL